jgi:hypothetical protein
MGKIVNEVLLAKFGDDYQIKNWDKKYGFESRGTALAKTSSNRKLQTRPLVRKGATITNPQLFKENFKDKEKLVVGSRRVSDTKTDWPTECRS